VLFVPGTQWEYSNTGFLVLGAVIEPVTGQNYFTYIRTQLYEPFGMSRTEAYKLDRVNWSLAVGYDKEFTDTEIRMVSKPIVAKLQELILTGTQPTTDV
jgi:CubicO group peptidase (beta-lactamase class C family)